MKMVNKIKKELISDYFNSHYKHINLGFNFADYKKKIINEYGNLMTKNENILDIGFGTGFLLRALEESGYMNLWGVEKDKTQFKEAKKILKNSKIYNEDIFDFFKGNNKKFKIIFLFDLIEHIPKECVIPMLKHIYTSLDKNGLLIIKTPNAESPLFCGRMRYNDFTHEIAFAQISIKMVLREAGFKEIICKPTKFYYSSLRLVLSGIVRFLGDLTLRLYLASYLGIKQAMNLILTYNFITIAKK